MPESKFPQLEVSRKTGSEDVALGSSPCIESIVFLPHAVGCIDSPFDCVSDCLVAHDHPL